MKARLFIGLALPYPIRKQLASLPDKPEGAKSSPAENLHITLVFIGESERDRIDGICAAMRNVRAESFPLALRGLGRFDNRVLWTAVTSHPQLYALEDKITDALKSIGVDFDHRPFRPHITIARLRSSTSEDAVSDYIDAHSKLKSPTFIMDKFYLYEAVSTPEGSRYIQLETFALTAVD